MRKKGWYLDTSEDEKFFVERISGGKIYGRYSIYSRNSGRRVDGVYPSKWLGREWTRTKDPEEVEVFKKAARLISHK